LGQLPSSEQIKTDEALVLLGPDERHRKRRVLAQRMAHFPRFRAVVLQQPVGSGKSGAHLLETAAETLQRIVGRRHQQTQQQRGHRRNQLGTEDDNAPRMFADMMFRQIFSQQEPKQRGPQGTGEKQESGEKGVHDCCVGPVKSAIRHRKLGAVPTATILCDRK